MKTVLQSIKKLAESGTNIFCTIHQPSSQVFGLFNRLLLLAQGNIAYLGSTKKGRIGNSMIQSEIQCSSYSKLRLSLNPLGYQLLQIITPVIITLKILLLYLALKKKATVKWKKFVIFSSSQKFTRETRRRK